MKAKTLLLISVAIIIVLAIFLLQNKESSKANINIGDKAPDFALEDINGNTVKLNDFLGRAVYINFWASWCPFCINEMPDIQKLHEEFGDKLIVLAVNRGEKKDVALNYLNSVLTVKVTYNVLFDFNEEVSNVYIPFGMPVSYFIDKEGKIVTRNFGVIDLDTMRNDAAKAVGIKIPKEPKDKKIYGEIKTTSTGIKYIVDPSKFLSGGPPKGGIGVDKGIPALKDPKFITVVEAEKEISDDEYVLGLYLDSIAKAYPISILNWHEIINDKVKDKPILITYCPLCATGIGFERTINSEELNFGVSGKLYNNNLIMYDDKTDSYWYQLLGKSIYGELTGNVLKKIQVDTVKFGDWKKAHPNTLVLSKDTGFLRDYNRNPYEGYEKDEGIFFPVENTDSRLPNKEIIYGLSLNNKAKAYQENKIIIERVINDKFADENILAVLKPDTKAVRFFKRNNLEFTLDGNKLVDQNNMEWSFDGDSLDGKNKLEQIQAVYSYWFSWVAFYNNTEIYNIS